MTHNEQINAVSVLGTEMNYNPLSFTWYRNLSTNNTESGLRIMKVGE